MNRKTIVMISVLCIAAAYAAGVLFSAPRKGDVVEAWETTNRTFKLRVKMHTEKGFRLVGGAIYVFESAATGSESWKEIMTVRHDDPNPIPRKQVRFVNDQVGYVFMRFKYAVTVDGGVTWSVWDATADLPDWRRSRANIEDVRLAPDGTGAMSLTSSTNQETPKLRTEDYGRHWTAR